MERQEGPLRMLSWLSTTPNLEKVARALVLDYFSLYHASQVKIWHLNKADALTCLAIFGGDDSSVGSSIPGSIWRNHDGGDRLAQQAHNKRSPTWSDGNHQAVINLYAQNLLIGFLTFSFSKPVEVSQALDREVEQISSTISLYIALRFLDALAARDSSHIGRHGMANLTARQHEVLSGIKMKKTNNMIAKELGYSVSTIRHETMRIFDALGVSDRFEAAAFAKKNGIA